MNTINSKQVLFIHGAFVSYQCWDKWIPYFESKGYTAFAPPWPFKDADAKTLRSRHPDAKVASLHLTPLINYYIDIVEKMPERPIVIGHSLGGLITQIIVNRGFADAGAAIHSVPPHGVMPTQFSFFRSTWKSLGLFTSSKKTYLMSPGKWRYAFTNGMSPDEQEKSYQKFAVPESKVLLRDGLTSAADVDFKKSPAPLLILAGDTDHCVPASLNLKNFKRYSNSNSNINYKVLKGRNHFVLGQPTWQEDADYILSWIQKHNNSNGAPFEKKEIKSKVNL